jgi:predicted membrane channel-forming protein YqfA (hemolysin III family)
MLLYSQYFRKVTEQNWKITEELVFITPAIRYTLKSLTWNCIHAQNSLCQKHKMVFERAVHAQI